MKAHAIASSLWAVDRLLPASGRILDLGCSIGFAAIDYCVRSPDRHLVGCDISAKSIVRARAEAARRGIQNIAFELADIQEGLPDGIFDAVVSSQVLGGIPDRCQALRRVAESLSDDGVLISIEPIGYCRQGSRRLRRGGRGPRPPATRLPDAGLRGRRATAGLPAVPAPEVTASGACRHVRALLGGLCLDRISSFPQMRAPARSRQRRPPSKAPAEHFCSSLRTTDGVTASKSVLKST